jgi:uncharacterized protein
MHNHFSKIFILLILLLLAWIAWLEPNSMTINKKVIELSNWHKEHNGYKIAVISDLHISWPYINENKVRQIVELTNAQKPDLVVILGDYAPADLINHFATKSQIKNEIIKPLEELKNLDKPVISVLGNHDWGFNGDFIRNILKKSGIKVLENQSTVISKNNEAINIAGVADLWFRTPNIYGTLGKIKNKDPIILLSHNPDLFPDVPKRVELTLAGHTHGGQINLPIIRAYLAPSAFGERYIKGLIKEKNHYIFVSSGIGTTCLPLRFLDPPEITILEIRKKNNFYLSYDSSPIPKKSNL